MSKKDYSAELLKMEGAEIEKFEEDEKEIRVQVSLARKAQSCKRCGAETDRVHDYRIRQVQDLELRGKPLRLLYRQRRYVCVSCGNSAFSGLEVRETGQPPFFRGFHAVC